MPSLRKLLCALFAFALLFTSANAFAGSLIDGKSGKDKIYKSWFGYSFNPPKDWVKLDAASAKSLPVTPNNLKDIDISRYDVIFFPYPEDSKLAPMTLKADDDRIEKIKAAKENGEEPPKEEKPSVDEIEFASYVSVAIDAAAPESFSNNGLKQYKQRILENYSTVMPGVSDFKITNDTKDSSKANTYMFDYTYRYESHDIKVQQTIFFLKDKTLVVSCVEDVNDPNISKNWCSKIIRSFKLK